MACAPCSVLCTRLGAACAARRYVRSALCALGAVCAARASLSIFLHQNSETRDVFRCPANLARRCFGSNDERG